MALTKKQRDDYIKDGTTCPFCGGTISGGEFVFGAGSAEATSYCEDCGEAFYEEYKMVDVKTEEEL